MSAATQGGHPSAPRSAAGRMAAAAGAFLDALDAEQRARAQWPFPSDDERRVWFYTPTDHGGLPLGAMTVTQQRRAYQLLASGLSRGGYVTATMIMGLENVLDHQEGFGGTMGRVRLRDPLMYFVRVFGDPSGDEPWSWRIGGHHLSLQFTIVDGQLEGVTPCFFGADPASVPLLGPHPLRLLAGVEDIGRELVRSLDDGQQATAIVSPRAPVDVVGANRADLTEGDLPRPIGEMFRPPFEGAWADRMTAVQARFDANAALTADDLEVLAYSRSPKGLAARHLRADQREMLDALLRLYVGRLPDDVADAEMARFAGPALDDIHVLWAGGLEPGQPHYYRLHGPTLVVEYDNSQNDVNHVHSVWRDPRGDFGAGALARHYVEHHH